MTITLVETPGSATANTYANLAEAEAFMATLSFAEAWTASDEAKKAALVNAARLMGTMGWKGTRTNQDQALAWPRCASSAPTMQTIALTRGINVDWLLDRDGYQVDPATIPQCIKDAQCAFALALMDDDRAADAGGLAPTTLKVGTLHIENLRRSMIPAVVYDLCGFFLASTPGRVRVERS